MSATYLNVVLPLKNAFCCRRELSDPFTVFELEHKVLFSGKPLKPFPIYSNNFSIECVLPYQNEFQCISDLAS